MHKNIYIYIYIYIYIIYVIYIYIDIDIDIYRYIKISFDDFAYLVIATFTQGGVVIFLKFKIKT